MAREQRGSARCLTGSPSRRKGEGARGSDHGTRARALCFVRPQGQGGPHRRARALCFVGPHPRPPPPGKRRRRRRRGRPAGPPGSAGTLLHRPGPPAPPAGRPPGQGRHAGKEGRGVGPGQEALPGAGGRGAEPAGSLARQLVRPCLPVQHKGGSCTAKCDAVCARRPEGSGSGSGSGGHLQHLLQLLDADGLQVVVRPAVGSDVECGHPTDLGRGGETPPHQVRRGR